MSKINRLVAWGLLFVCMFWVAVGCQNTPVGKETHQEDSASTATQPSQELHVNLRTEPPVLYPALATDTTSGLVLYHVLEGLTRLGENGQVRPGMATSWQVSDDGMTYTFFLRKTAKWSDGQPVTAHDFVYSWLKMLDPKTASNIAYHLYPVKNAKAFNEGKAQAEDVGIRALDDYTLQVTFEHPVPHFLNLTSHQALLPIPKHVDEANPNWYKEAATFVGNGPFQLAEWIHDSHIVPKKNSHYWAKDEVKLDAIHMAMVNDENTEYQMFETGQLDVATPPLELTKELLDAGKAKAKPMFATYYLVLNTRDPVLKNPKIRKALALAIDRRALVETVLQGEQIPATGMVPPGAPGLNGDFRAEQGGLLKDGDVEAAKALLQEGLRELGLTKLPPLTYKFNTGQGHQKVAEAIQQMWKQHLGVDIKLANEEWKVYLASLDQGNFQIGRQGWVGEYLDAMTFLDLFVTDGGNNHTGWSNARYDRLIAEAQSTADPAKRIRALQEAEKLLMEEMPIIPIYFYTRVYMEKPHVRGVIRNIIYETDYSRAWLER